MQAPKGTKVLQAGGGGLQVNPALPPRGGGGPPLHQSPPLQGGPGAQVTCFTSTKVQILTPEELLERNARLTLRALDFRACSLHTLLMGQCALDWVPNLATISSLTDLSLFSLHIQARGTRRDAHLFFEVFWRMLAYADVY